MTTNQKKSSLTEKASLPTFVLPAVKKPMDEQYSTDVTPNESGKIHVTVYHVNDEGKRRDIYGYDRNYSMMKTFAPFRQFKDGAWHDYALISSNYMFLEVLDLESGTVIAKEQMPVMTQKRRDEGAQRGLSLSQMSEIGTPLPGNCFCPIEFYVPDLVVEEELLDAKECSYYVASLGNDEMNDANFKYAAKARQFALDAYSGQWALYGGCLWGDDNYVKLRYIDLSRISEGIVVQDERFGYVAMGESDSIKDMIKIRENTSPLHFDVAVAINFNMQTGEARGKDYFAETLNWKADGGW